MLPAKCERIFFVALVGGPPCQGFSINAPGRFLDDPRNKLFSNYLGFVQEFRPKTLLFENVTGMLSLEKGAVFRKVVHELEALGYFCEAKVLFAAHYGVPQERWRLIILGSRVGLAIEHPLPTHYLRRRANFTGGKTLTFPLDESHRGLLRPPVTVADAILDLPEPIPAGGKDVGLEYRDTPSVSRFSTEMRGDTRLLFNHVEPRLSPVNLERLKHIKPGGSWRDIPFALLPAGMKKARRSDHTKRYGRLHPDGLASTIMTKCDPHWGPVFHPVCERSLTVREAARFQSFPDHYVFEGSKVAQYEQVGNAVPPLLARAIAFRLIEHVLRSERKCRNGLFFVCPTPVYRRIRERLGGDLQEFHPQPGALTFLHYSLGSEVEKTTGNFPLSREGSFTTTIDQVAPAFSAPRNLPPAGAYEHAIQDALKA